MRRRPPAERRAEGRRGRRPRRRSCRRPSPQPATTTPPGWGKVIVVGEGTPRPCDQDFQLSPNGSDNCRLTDEDPDDPEDWSVMPYGPFLGRRRGRLVRLAGFLVGTWGGDSSTSTAPFRL